MRRVINAALTPGRVKRLLKANAGREEVCFTSGEPTLVKELFAYCAWARDLGYQRISLMTNGRRLSYSPYVVALIKAGVNLFYISIHGHTAKLHDGLVRTPAAFAQTVAGLDNVARFKESGVSLHTSTVVNKRNYDFFEAIYVFLRGRMVDQVVFNVMQPNGRANTYFERLFPRYSDIAARYLAFLEACSDPRPQSFLVDVPLCITERIPDHNRGYVERSAHFVPTTNAAVEGGCVAVTMLDTEIEDLMEVTRTDMDVSERTKRLECTRCVYDFVCEGVWRNYTARFGWDEFVPVEHRGSP